MKIALLVTAAVVGLVARSGAVTFVRDGQPAAVIVVPLKPGGHEQQSAEELQRYLETMSGARLPITSRLPVDQDCILIGRRPESLAVVGKLLSDKYLGYDGIIIKTSGRRLIVLGNKGNGQLFATYELLKRLDCRFYLPHPDGEVVPHRTTITIEDLDYAHKPDFIRRNFANNGYVKPGLAHWEWWSSWEPKVHMGGVEIVHNHAYGYICPPSKYFADHPEYFPLRNVNGQMMRVSSGQLCLSNPDVVKLAADFAIAAFDSDPGRRAMTLSPNDTKGWCECDACRAMDSPDPNVGVAWRVLKFNNAVAETVSKKYPDRWLTYYAEYMNLPGPPVGMKAHPMIMPIIVDRYDMMHSVYDPYMGDTSKTGIHYNPDYGKVWDAWHRIARQLGVYEWYQLAKPPQLPSPMLYPIGDRIRFYRDQGACEYYGELIGRSPVNDLTVYVASQMLWDADQDPKQIREEFFDLYFAESARPMRKYYDMMHETSFYSNENRGCYVPRTAWSPDLITRLYAKLAEAQSLAKQDVVKRRLGREFKSLKVTDLCAQAFSAGDKWLDDGDAAARDLCRAKITEVRVYLLSIKDEDIVADTRMIKFLDDLREQIDKRPVEQEKGLQP